MGLPRWLSGKESACQCRRHRRCRFSPWVGKIPWRKKWQPAPVLLPGEPHGLRSLQGYSLSGCKELDTTERLSKGKKTKSHMTFQNLFFQYPYLCMSKRVKHPCIQLETTEDIKVYVTQGKHILLAQSWEETQKPSLTYTGIGDKSELGHTAFLIRGAALRPDHP